MKKIKIESPTEENKKIKTFIVSGNVTDEIIKNGMDKEFKSSLFISLIGALFLIFGIFLLINGFAGSASWILKLSGKVESQLWDAPIGIILSVIGGLIVLIRGKPIIKIKKK